MAITIAGSGPVEIDLSPNRTSFSSVPSYSFCSGVLATTAAYTANQVGFGAQLQEIHIVNLGANPIAFQFAEFFGTSKDSGVVLANDQVVIRKALKSGLAVRSADPALASTVVVFGV
jgi:hypothetical protein